MATSPLGSLPSLAGIPQPQAFNPLEALISGLQQGVALRQLPQQIQNDQLNQQLKQALMQAQVEAIPLERQRQLMALKQLEAQLNPNYAAEQNAQKIAFDTAREEAMLGVRQRFEQPKQVPLKFTETDNEIITQDPFTGAEKSRIKKLPGVKYENRVNGVFAFTDPNNPLLATLVPGTQPITQDSAGQPVPQYDASGKLLGYVFPKGFQSTKDLEPKPVTPKERTLAQDKAKVSGAQAALAESKLEKLKVDPTYFVPGVIERFKSTGRKDFEQAANEFTEAALRFKTGAAVTKDEVSQALKIWIPQPGDDTTTIANKKVSRDLLIREMRESGGGEPASVTGQKSTKSGIKYTVE